MRAEEDSSDMNNRHTGATSVGKPTSGSALSNGVRGRLGRSGVVAAAIASGLLAFSTGVVLFNIAVLNRGAVMRVDAPGVGHVTNVQIGAVGAAALVFCLDLTR